MSLMLFTKGSAHASGSTKILKTVLLLAAIMLAACSKPAVDPLPPELKTLKLGISPKEVEAMIKGSGEYTKASLKKRKTATGITWIPKKSRYYKKIVFQFAEDDRLYLVGFYTKSDMRWKLRPLRNGFISKFDIMPQRPSRMTVGGADMLSYTSTDHKLTLFDYRGVRTGENAFEIFSAGISRHGRDLVKRKAASGKGKTATKAVKANPTSGGSPDAAVKGEPLKPAPDRQGRKVGEQGKESSGKD
jgi:hypothetical protein